MSSSIILASGSPRRIRLLSRITSQFTHVPSEISEDIECNTAKEKVMSLARRKAEDVAQRYSGVVIGADTIVVVDKDILEKPTSRADAQNILAKLSNREHQVLTGLYVLNTDKREHRQACEETTVRFRMLTDREISEYLDRGEYRDKAGAYAIQGYGAILVEEIRGDYYNVMGLPLCKLYLLLQEMRIQL